MTGQVARDDGSGRFSARSAPISTGCFGVLATSRGWASLQTWIGWISSSSTTWNCSRRKVQPASNSGDPPPSALRRQVRRGVDQAVGHRANPRRPSPASNRIQSLPLGQAGRVHPAACPRLADLYEQHLLGGPRPRREPARSVPAKPSRQARDDGSPKPLSPAWPVVRRHWAVGGLTRRDLCRPARVGGGRG